MRTQLCRVFRKYVSPETPVEMLKKTQKQNKFAWNLEMDLDQFMLSKINLILALFLMKLYVLFCGSIKTGAKGYDLTEKIFDMMQNQIPRLVCMGSQKIWSRYSGYGILEGLP